MKPFLSSVRTRPPTPSPASSMVTATPPSDNTFAQVRPANPAPTIITLIGQRVYPKRQERLRSGSHQDALALSENACLATLPGEERPTGTVSAQILQERPRGISASSPGTLTFVADGDRGNPTTSRDTMPGSLGPGTEREKLQMEEHARPMASMTRRQFLRRSGKAALAVTVLSQAQLLIGCEDNNKTIWDELARRLKGPLVRPGDASYGTLHLPFNRRYEAVRPQGIASCIDPSDVRESVLWAREHEVPVAIRSGGHNYAGYSTTDGLLIDL